MLQVIPRQSIANLTYDQQNELADIAIRLKMDIPLNEKETKIWQDFCDKA